MKYNTEIEVYFKNLSKKTQSKILQWRDIDRDIINNRIPLFVIFPCDVQNFAQEYNDEYFYDPYEDQDDVCDKDCAICEKPYCDIRDAIDIDDYNDDNDDEDWDEVENH